MKKWSVIRKMVVRYCSKFRLLEDYLLKLAEMSLLVAFLKFWRVHLLVNLVAIAQQKGKQILYSGCSTVWLFIHLVFAAR